MKIGFGRFSVLSPLIIASSILLSCVEQRYACPASAGLAPRAKELDLAAGRRFMERDFGAARGRWLSAVDAQRSTLGPRDLDLAWLLHNLGVIYKERNPRLAERWLREALTVREERCGPNVDVARSARELGDLYIAKGDLRGAKPLHERASSIYRDTAASLRRRLARLEATGGNDREVAQTLYAIADIDKDTGDQEDAIRNYLRFVEIHGRNRWQTDDTLITAWRSLAELYDDRGDDRAYLWRERLVAAREKREPKQVAVEQVALARTYERMGRYGDARSLAERARAILVAVSPLPKADLMAADMVLARALRRLGDPKIADEIVSRVLSMCDDPRGRTEPLTLRALILQDRGDYRAAETTLRTISAIPSQSDRVRAAHLNNLAALYEVQGRYEEAERALKEAIDAHQRALGDGHPGSAELHGNLARVRHRRGEYDRAEDGYKQALGLLARVGAEKGSTAAVIRSNLGKLREDRGDYEGAAREHEIALEPLRRQGSNLVVGVLTNLSRAERLSKKYELAHKHASAAFDLLGEDRSSVTAADVLTELGLALLDSRLPDMAGPPLEQAAKIQEKWRGSKHPDTARALNNWATALFEVSRLADAEERYRSALEIWKTTLGPSHAEVALVLENLAALRGARGEIPQAIEHREEARAIRDRHLALNLASGSESKRRAYAQMLGPSTDAAVSLHLHRAPGRQDAAHLALSLVVGRKGVVLDAMIDSASLLRSKLDERDRPIFDELSSTRAALAHILGTAPEGPAGEAHRRRLNELEARAEGLEKKLRATSEPFRGARGPVSLEGVRAAIPAGAVLVEIIRYRLVQPDARRVDKEEHYAAYVLHRDGPILARDLGPAKPIDDSIDDLRRALARPSSDISGPARNLDMMVMAPLDGLLGDARLVYLSPDSHLQIVPFGALLDPGGHFRIEHLSITYLASGRDLLEKESLAPRDGMVLFANPNLIASPSGWVLPPLGRTEEEINAIHKIFPRARRLTGNEATESAVKTLHGPSVLHLATHGFLRRPSKLSKSLLESPLAQSGLFLAPGDGERGHREDGELTAMEVSSLDLGGTRLVVLSACNSALGEVAPREGVYGLRRAFAIAGAETMVMSLWSVDDASTKALMSDYYEGLGHHHGRAEALHQAQRRMLQKGKWRHPYHWASFIVSGQAAPLDETHPTHPLKPPPSARGCACLAAGTPGEVPHQLGTAALLIALRLIRRLKLGSRRPSLLGVSNGD